jgi:hypothetical protein
LTSAPGAGQLRSRMVTGPVLVLYLAAANFALHMLVAANYGYFRDELYYIVSGQHLQLGYVDFPPMIAYIAWLMGLVAGDGLIAIHVVPALAGAALVFVGGMIAKELGGGRTAQLLAAAGTLVTAQLAFSSIFSMDILDALWWTLASYLLIRILKRGDSRLWLAFGLVAGLGLMTKLTIAFFLLAVLVSLLATPARTNLRSRWFWGGVLIALAFSVPYIAWNAANGWPTVDFYFHHGGLNGSGPIDFALLQLLIANPLNVPLIIAGLFFFFRTRAGRPFTAIGLASVILFVLFLVIDGKPYFYEGAYPALIAAGSVWVASRTSKRVWAAAVLLLAIVAGGAVVAPLEMPILPPADFVASYGSVSGIANGAASQGNVGAFPQYLGDRFGWDTMTASVASVYQALPAQEKAQACIFTENYGEASALTFLGKSYGLPHVISGHNNFYLWGPGPCSGQVIIAVGLYLGDLQKSFANVTQVGIITCSYCVSEENDLPIYLATNPLASTQSIWPTVKHFD